MRSKEEMDYSVVLLPTPENGGESFRNSFALTFEAPPTRENSDQWGNTIAHEIFHLWNGWRLRGADYPSTQWFQEGFTEYAATISMVNVGLAATARFREKLAAQVQNYRRLKTSLTGSGTHKGPPLYSGGALVAFCWDVILRHETGGKRGFGDFMRELWRQTGSGERPYEWSDLKASLSAIASYDWDGFYRKYIEGKEALPLPEAFSLAGLKLEEDRDKSARVIEESSATNAAKAIWSSLVKGR
jgi:predicted metalloprotease with PDZ domain